MRIEFRQQDKDLKAVLIGDDPDQELEWSFRELEKSTKDHREAVFPELNNYWGRLPLERRQKLYALYEHAYDILEYQPLLNMGVLKEQLSEVCEKILDLHPEHELFYHLERYEKIRFPDTVPVANTDNFNPKKNYYVKKYLGLLTLSLAFRAIVPIWSAYLRYIGAYSGTEYKEIIVFSIVSRSWLLRSSYMKDLTDYIEANTLDNTSTASSVIDGIGSANLLDWFLADACIRKLAIKPINGDGEKNNLIAKVHSAIMIKIRKLTKTRKGLVEDKFKSAGGSKTNGEKDSIMEEFKIKTPITEGDKSAFVFAAHHLINHVQSHIPDVDMALYQTLLQYMDIHVLSPVMVKAQERLIQWVIAPYFPARAMGVLRMSALKVNASIAQLLLAQWGFADIAVYLGATVREEDEFLATDQVRTNIPRKLIQTLTEKYPHNIMSLGSSTKTATQINRACVDIEAVAVELLRHEWQLNAPSVLIDMAKATGQLGAYEDGDLSTTPDIRRRLAELVIHIHDLNT